MLYSGASKSGFAASKAAAVQRKETNKKLNEANRKPKTTLSTQHPNARNW